MPALNVGHVHPVQEQDVKVNVQVQRTAKVLDKGDGAGAGCCRDESILTGTGLSTILTDMVIIIRVVS